MADLVIEACGLTKFYGRDAAVDRLSFSVRRGEVYALLGRNGAGKTTAVAMILGLVEPTRGEARVFGHPSGALPPDVRARVGYLAEGHHIYPWMRIDELARFTQGTHPRWNGGRFRGFLEYFGIEPRRRLGKLSNGQRAQVSLAAVLACDPELLVLDDPTLGVDVAVRRDFMRGVIDLVSQEERTVLLTTHHLADVERVADRIGIMDGGLLRADLPLDEFRRSVVRYRLVFDGRPPDVRVPRLVATAAGDHELTVTVARPGADTERALHEAGAARVEEVELSLEDAFIDFTAAGRATRPSFGEIASR